MDELLQNLPEPKDVVPLTLEEALEFIDSCELLPCFDNVNNDSPESQTIAAENETSQPMIPKHKKRVRNPLNDVHRRQRKKAERLQLKEQVRDYEVLVERLQQARKSNNEGVGDETGTSTLSQCSTESPWRHIVVEEEQKRRKAEDVNDKLKSLLVERLQMTEAIRDVLMKKSARLTRLDPTEDLYCFPLQSSPLQSSLPEYDFTTAELQRTVGQTFASTDTVLGPISIDAFNALESISRVKHDRTTGTCVELITTTPLTCKLNTVKTILWEIIMDKQWPGAQSRFILKTKQCSPQSVELRFSMSFAHPQVTQIKLEGATLLEIRDEEHRSVLAWTSIVVHPSDQLRFRSQGWVVVLKSPTDAQGASAVRMCCRVSAECANTNDTLMGKTRSIILRSMGERVKSRLEDVQKQLLSRTGLQERLFI